MSNYEIFYLWGFIPIVILGIILSCVILDGHPGIFFIILGIYCFSGMIFNEMTDLITTMTSETPINVLFERYDENGVKLLLENDRVVEFTKFSDVEKWKSTKTLIRQEFEKKDKFGVDSKWVEYVIGN